MYESNITLYPLSRTNEHSYSRSEGTASVRKSVRNSGTARSSVRYSGTARNSVRNSGAARSSVRNNIRKSSLNRGVARIFESRSALVICGILLIVIGTLILVMGISGKDSNVEASTIKEKYYTSIEVGSGDTLWSLAEEYGEPYQDYRIFIDEVKSINRLDGDHITYGASLMIPVYR